MELIKIEKSKGGRDIVSARELHEFLEIETPLHKWAPRMIEYGFIENVDWTKMSADNQSVDYAITLETAKHWSMMQRTEKGMQARKYFIDCEQKLKSQIQLPQTFAEALQLAADQAKQIELQQKEIKELEPKAEVFDKISNADGLLTLNQAAKTIGIGHNTMTKLLREMKKFQPNKTIPYQSHIDAGHFEVKTNPIQKGERLDNYTQTFVTGKGLTYLTNKLK